MRSGVLPSRLAFSLSHHARANSAPPASAPSLKPWRVDWRHRYRPCLCRPLPQLGQSPKTMNSSYFFYNCNFEKNRDFDRQGLAIAAPSHGVNHFREQQMIPLTSGFECLIAHCVGNIRINETLVSHRKRITFEFGESLPIHPSFSFFEVFSMTVSSLLWLLQAYWSAYCIHHSRISRKVDSYAGFLVVLWKRLGWWMLAGLTGRLYRVWWADRWGH